MNAPALRLTITLALTALYIVGRLAFVWLPNVSLSFLALAVAGFAYGARIGAAVGFLGRIGSDLVISGLNPIVLPMCLVETILGGALGLLGHAIDAPRLFTRSTIWIRIILFDLGAVLTLAYSIMSDSLTWLFYNLVLTTAPDAARGTLWTTLVVMGLAFSVVPAILHGVLFAAGLPPIMRSLEASSLLAEKHRPERPKSVETTE